MAHASLRLGLGAGMVLAVPIPPQYAAEGRLVEGAIKTALDEVDAKGVKGQEVRSRSCLLWACGGRRCAVVACYAGGRSQCERRRGAGAKGLRIPTPHAQQTPTAEPTPSAS